MKEIEAQELRLGVKIKLGPKFLEIKKIRRGEGVHQEYIYVTVDGVKEFRLCQFHKVKIDESSDF